MSDPLLNVGRVASGCEQEAYVGAPQRVRRALNDFRNASPAEQLVGLGNDLGEDSLADVAGHERVPVARRDEWLARAAEVGMASRVLGQILVERGDDDVDLAVARRRLRRLVWITPTPRFTRPRSSAQSSEMRTPPSVSSDRITRPG
jgi:hypothetical protein